MAKPQLSIQPTLRNPTPAAVPEPQGVKVTHPLFGVVKGADGKWLAVRYLDGVALPITPSRGGKDTGESKHFAVARAVEAFRVALQTRERT